MAERSASSSPTSVVRQGPESWERLGKTGTYIGRRGAESWVAVSITPHVLRRERGRVAEAETLRAEVPRG